MTPNQQRFLREKNILYVDKMNDAMIIYLSS